MKCQEWHWFLNLLSLPNLAQYRENPILKGRFEKQVFSISNYLAFRIEYLVHEKYLFLSINRKTR